jgi:alcohol dehydrogenase class IV
MDFLFRRAKNTADKSVLRRRKCSMGNWIIDMDPGVVFGEDSRKVTGDKLKEYGATKVMLLHDEIMTSLGYTKDLSDIIREAGMEVIAYQTRLGEPKSGWVDEAARFALENKADGLVGLGGGATIDTAKFVGKLLANGGNAEDYLGYTNTSGSKTFRPIIVLPTTSGTGAEVNTALACDNESRGRKAFTMQRATLAIIDPTYTYGLPKEVTANTGIDALTHAAESLCNSAAMPNWMADTLGKECVKLVFEWLPTAYNEPGNKDARAWMSYAAMLGGYTIKLRKTTFGHALAQPIGNTYHYPHGVCCSVGMAAVVRYNVTGDPASTRLLAGCCGVPCPEDADMIAVGNEVVKRFDGLQKAVGMKNMRELGIPKDFVNEMVDQVSKDEKWKVVPNPPDFELLRKVTHESYDY